ncbi:MAG: TCP-1/cpn60 chaperonin family protein, partial [Planctomycetota bacterium]|nr:TCP-1/cpn60 chaperonin family protein [Planctomycetota bacterium]
MPEDLAIMTGARVISDDVGLKLSAADIDDLGRAKRVMVDKQDTLILEGAGDEDDIRLRIDQVRQQTAETTSSYDREKLQERLGKLAGGVAKVLVGAHTEAELKERKARVEDAIQATRAAVEEGIVVGGGVALLRASLAVAKLNLTGDEALGAHIVESAVTAPIKQIAHNAGESSAVVVKNVLESTGNSGFNAYTLQYSDLFAEGVIDPTKVTRSALENAASIAAMMLTTEAIVGNAKAD